MNESSAAPNQPATSQAATSQAAGVRATTAEPLAGPDFSRNGGLLPAIAQDATTGQVLMLAWMNALSFAETVRSGRAFYISGCRQRICRIVVVSGHWQTVRAILIDCDADTILLKVEQTGAACHEGYATCFFRAVVPEGLQIVASRLVDPAVAYGGKHG